ncbi:MAG: D-Ala-D-Ala carboxypeptidase family metallohydrolase [Thermoplasmatales archaeon]
MINWQDYAPYFKESEFRCKHTGISKMDKEFMDILLQIRKEYGKPMVITSGYRHPTHPIEVRKGGVSGEHTTGRCADIACGPEDAFRLMIIALMYGITRIGVQQKGDINTRFLHLGIGAPGLPNRVVWSYP